MKGQVWGATEAYWRPAATYLVNTADLLKVAWLHPQDEDVAANPALKGKRFMEIFDQTVQAL